jgi:hypothetical protein
VAGASRLDLMSVSTLNDPSGVGFNQFHSTGGRPDDVSGVNPYQDQSLNQWIIRLHLQIRRTTSTERMRVQFGAQVSL